VSNLRILLVHPGASWSTHDVFTGLHDAFQRQGVEIIEYALDNRLEHAAHFLKSAWKRSSKQAQEPSVADILYQASLGILERALRHKADWVFIISSMYVHPDILIMLRRAHIRAAVLFTESPYEDRWQLELAPYVQACWTNERASLPAFLAANDASFYYQHAIDPTKHMPGVRAGDEDVLAHDVVFVGTGFQERCDMLAATDWTGIDLGLYGSWNLLGSRSKLRKYVRAKVIPNETTSALYRRARLGLNLHRTSTVFGPQAEHIENAESMGPRCYELAAAGLPFASDYRAEVAEVFGDLVPTFTTGSELRAIIDRSLHDAGERARIAHELPGCVAGHTFDARVTEILKVLQQA